MVIGNIKKMLGLAWMKMHLIGHLTTINLVLSIDKCMSSIIVEVFVVGLQHATFI